MPKITAFGVAATALVVSMGLTLYLLHHALFPKTPITLQQPLAVPAIVIAGDVLPVTTSYCKPEARHATVGYALMSDDAGPIRLIPLPATLTALPAGCHEVVVYQSLPAYTPPGRYRLYITPEYRLTPFLHAQRLFVSDAFVVVAR